jgi:DNA polymerase-1
MRDIIDLGLENVYNLERECIQVTGDMEINGIKIDFGKWAKLEATAKKDILEKKKILDEHFKEYCDIDLFGEPSINYDSPKQVKPILEAIIGFTIPGTGKDVLERYEYNSKAIKALLEYRQAVKKVTTYGVSFYNEHVNKTTGRIHTNFIQTGATDSGRYASNNPNIQNIPADEAYRAAFVSEPGWKIVGADYSGMELRLLAEFSKDERFMEIFLKGYDPHKYVSSMLFDIPYDSVTKEQRKVGKAVNFGR